MIENYDNKKIQIFEYETTAISDGNIAGTCELGNATIQMINDSNEYSSLKGQWIKTIHGSFYIHDVEPVQEKVNIKLSCYDIKYKLDSKYDSSLYTWPMTLIEWRNAIATNCGITFGDSSFPNSNLILIEEPYIGDNPSNRDAMKKIAQAGCSWVDSEADDKCYFRWFDNTRHTVDDWIELTTEKENSNPINVVILGRGDVEDNVKWPEIEPQNSVEFRIDNNYILDPQIEGQDQRYDVIQSIYNRVNGFSYIPFNMRTQNVQNKLSIKLGQKISYKDIWGNNLTAYVMTKKINYLGGDPLSDDNYEITLSAEEIKETSTDYSYAASVENRLLRVERTADKQNGIITDLVESQTAIEKEFTPQKSVSGSNIHIEDASDNKMVEFEIEGKSEQKTRSGKNLLKFANKERVANGITITFNDDGSIRLNGTATATVYCNINAAYYGSPLTTQYFTLEKGESYTCYLKNRIAGVSIRTRTVSQNSNFFPLQGVEEISSRAYTGETDEQAYCYLDISKDTVLDNLIVYPMIVKGSYTLETIGEFEPYGVMPSPEYPSEIKSVGYENLFDGSYVDFAVGGNSGSQFFQQSNCRTAVIKVKANTIYTITKFGNDKGNRFTIADYPSYVTSTTELNGLALNHNAETLTVKTNSDANYLYVYVSNESVEPLIQLSKDPQQHSYVPYGKYGIEVKNTGDNLFTGFVKGKGLNSGNGVETTNNSGAVSDYISIDFDKATSYTLSGLTNTLASFVAGYDEDKVFVGRTAGTERTTLTFYNTTFGAGTPSSNKPIKYIRVYQYFRTSNTGTIDDIDNLEVMLNIGNKALSYEPYKKNTILFVLDEPLRSLSNETKDRAYIKDNKLYVDRKVENIIFDGNESYWNMSTSSITNLKAFWVYKSQINNCEEDSYDKYSNCFTYKKEDWRTVTTPCLCENTNLKSNMIIFSGFSDITSLDEWKTWLSTNNTEVQYELATPITEEIGELEMPSTFKGVNNISTTDALEPVMNITYLTDTLLNAQYATKGELNITAEQIKSELSKKVSSNELETSFIEMNNAITQTINDETNEIRQSVSDISSNLDETKSNINSVQDVLTSQGRILEIVSTNIDKTNGNITEVTTTNGFTFNSDGLNIYTDKNSYNTQIDNVGTYYKDGDEIISQTTKDGSVLTNLSEKGQTKYSYNNSDYDFIDERIEVDGEYAYATFYNGED